MDGERLSLDGLMAMFPLLSVSEIKKVMKVASSDQACVDMLLNLHSMKDEDKNEPNNENDDKVDNDAIDNEAIDKNNDVSPNDFEENGKIDIGDEIEQDVEIEEEASIEETLDWRRFIYDNSHMDEALEISNRILSYPFQTQVDEKDGTVIFN